MDGDQERRGPWRVLSGREVYDNPWLSVREDQVITPGGDPGIYGVVHFKNRAIAVLPLHDDGTVTLVGQYRYPLEAYSWELPEGGGPAHETPREAAERELREETGIAATTWREVLSVDMSNCTTDEAAFAFLATGLSEGEAAPEPDEDLSARRVPFAALMDEIDRGAIRDALTVVTALRVWRLAVTGALEPAVCDLILKGPAR